MDQAKLETVLRARLPGFEKLAACERLSAGASRETYKLSVRRNGRDELMALRRSPTGDDSAMRQGPGLTAEASLFEAARAAGVPGPEIFLVLEPGDDLGSGFVMEWIPGETLGARIARSPDFNDIRPKLARQCGEVLARLHQVDPASAGLTDTLDRMTPADCIRVNHERYLQLGVAQPMIDFTAKWLMANLPASHAMTLVHSDFRNGNLIVDKEKGVVAVLDWELAHIGDPMRDLGWIVTRSWRFGVPGKPVGGFGETDDLIAGYESISGRKVDRAAIRFWEVFGSFWWAVGTLSMAHSYRTGMETSVERPAIGRRTSECQIDCVNLLIPGRVMNDYQINTTPTPASDHLPTISELVISVRDFLRAEAAQSLAKSGDSRGSFLAKVAANSLDTVSRELRLGPAADAAANVALSELLGVKGETAELRGELCKAIRTGSIGLESPELQAFLRQDVLAQALIDMPDYAGTIEALGRT